MTGIRHELPLRAQRRLELTKHGIEARPQAAQLVAAVGGDAAREIAGTRDLLDGRGQALHRRQRGARDEQSESGREHDRPERELGERDAGLRERTIDVLERLGDLERAAVRDRPHQHANAILLRDRCGEEPVAFAGGNVLHVLGDERRDGHAEIRLDDGPIRIDDLAEDVLATGHQLRPAIPEGAAASGTPDERRLGQGVVYLLEELVLDDDVHRDRCADRGDRDRRGGEERDPEPEAHGSFMT